MHTHSALISASAASVGAWDSVAASPVSAGASVASTDVVGVTKFRLAGTGNGSNTRLSRFPSSSPKPQCRKGRNPVRKAHE